MSGTRIFDDNDEGGIGKYNPMVLVPFRYSMTCNTYFQCSIVGALENRANAHTGYVISGRVHIAA